MAAVPFSHARTHARTHTFSLLSRSCPCGVTAVCGALIPPTLFPVPTLSASFCPEKLLWSPAARWAGSTGSRRSTGRKSINQTVTLRQTEHEPRAVYSVCNRLSPADRAPGVPDRVGFCGFTGPDHCFGGERTGGGVASRFRNSIHCSAPTREENTSVEAAANQRRPSRPELRPAAYIKGSAANSVGHWHNKQRSGSAGVRVHLSVQSFILSNTMADTQVDSGSDISAKDLKEKKLVEEKENGKDAATNGKENEENGEPDVDDEEDEEVDEEDEEDDGEGDEEDEDEDDDEIEGGTKRAAEDDEDDDEDDVETKKQKTDDDD
ncbi:prothymosin alpha-B [Echeneis naucrates]|uniref:prothymosin alpha-B n=1 Tax=Echeneis naucrates TaxID=173247 RepID=UPI00111352CC|nr:HIV Tat-specific factor 1 homolog [Echeneis naucrates]